jgi:septal ring factor EnvC (AmiA/AmiB activator)
MAQSEQVSKLRADFADQLGKAQQSLQNLAQQQETLQKQCEQLRGAIYALDVVAANSKKEADDAAAAATAAATTATPSQPAQDSTPAPAAATSDATPAADPAPAASAPTGS